MKTICPLRQLRRRLGVTEPRQKHVRIDRAGGALEDSPNGNHPSHAIQSNETVFDISPFSIPADHARVNLEPLKCFEITAKLGDRITNYRKCLLLSCDSENAGTDKPMYATDVGERKISAVVDVKIDIQVIWPSTQRDTRSRQQINFGFAEQARSDTKQAQPRKHRNEPSRVFVRRV